MRRWYCAVMTYLAAVGAFAQPYGNEWIDHGRQYWRFQIAASGIYRIDSTALADAGFPVASVDPRDLQLFSREQQVPIYVAGEADGVFNGQDFIEFRADKNDGQFDVPLYDLPEHQNNPNYSLYNDTVRYYLTWDVTPEKLRIVDYSNTDFGSYTDREWFWYTARWDMADRYQPGDRTVEGATSAQMVEAEGFFRSEMTSAGNDATQNISMLTQRPYTGPNAGDAEVRIAFAGTNNPGGSSCPDHHTRILYGPTDLTAIDTIYRGYKLFRTDFTMDHTWIGPSYTTFKFRSVHDLDACYGGNGYLDRQASAFCQVRYPHIFHMNAEPVVKMELPDLPGDPPSTMTFIGIPGTPILYAYGDTVRRILPTQVGAQWKAIAPADPNADLTRLFMCTVQHVDTVRDLVPVNSTGYFTDLGQVQADSAMIIITNGSLMNAALQYAAYKENGSTHPHETVVVDVDELYDQFGGGIPKHPLAIRQFLKMAYDQWPTHPSALFLVGKSVIAPQVGAIAGYRNDPVAYAQCLVPTYGYPPSDNCFTLGISGDPRLIAIPVGRLAAKNDQEVLDYLDKVQTFESQPPAEWMKHILHFRGGGDASEWALFGSYLNAYKAVAEDTSFAGHVTTFVKTDGNLIDQASADSVNTFIQEGVSLMTFFAHASGGGFDITIDNPYNYEWNGHYPVVIGNSCYAGNIHLEGAESASERFVLLHQKGAIAFLASVDIGLTNTLFPFTQDWYRSFSQVNYGGTIGQHIQYAAFQQLALSYNVLTLNNVQTFTLQGDPTLVLNSWPKPDYRITLPDISYSPAPVTADVDTFQVHAVVTNLGKGVDRNVNAALERTLVEESQTLQPQFEEFDGGVFRDTVTFHVPVLDTDGGLGLNDLEVRVDLDPDQVPELDDTGNNVVNTSLLITSGEIFPVYPYEYAITPESAPLLEASTGDPFAPVRTYRFQIDTTDHFNSPIMESTTITAPGGVVTWQPQQIFALNAQTDSTVFFWRCSPDSTADNGFDWRGSSFQYLTDREGWGQAHFFQYRKDAFSQITYNEPARRFDFDAGLHQVRCDLVGSDGLENNWFLDLNWMEGQGCGSPTAMHVAVIEPATLQAWGSYYNGQNPDHQFGNVNNDGACRSRVERYFIFRTGWPAQMNALQNMLANEIPDGHYVLLWTYLYLNKDSVNMDPAVYPDLYATFNALGATGIATAPDKVPYIFFAKKGDLGSVQQVIGDSIDAHIELSAWIQATGHSGAINSVLAGPTHEWKAFYWDEKPNDPQDSVRIQVFGLPGPSGPEQLLYDLDGPLDSVPEPDFGAIADAQLYPYLRLKAVLRNDSVVDPVPSQMKRWQLIHSPVPECAIDPPSGYLPIPTGLYEGQDARVAVAVRNISPYDMDSLLIDAWVVDRTGQWHTVRHHYNAPLPAGGVVMDTIPIPTTDLGGANTIIIEANPVDSTTGRYDQYEQYHFNNIATLRFDINEDHENPLLDVTFDGVHILNGDIVSAKPEILVTLDDENTTLLLDSESDTTYFKVFLADPQGQRRLYFREGGEEIMHFVPASGPDNISHIEYHPVFPLDGTYTLTVQARDISNNASGDNDLKIDFEVINAATITEVLNYPNPFTTSTRFVFTVTGSEVPSYMKVQIMTISGRVVREITNAELGPMHVGRNITEYAWDGRDEFGDKLARGVYLYRVIAKLNGDDMELRSTGASGYFKQGFGKMYLLR
ncbi:MAG: hypothetical protein H6597_02095 [Flavobacteriales bacterium]|nr:hypothetical protein [Flavobacteriales bacterium]MCB9193297.1 hypothetical protein [Flavobacteriales bacterium]